MDHSSIGMDCEIVVGVSFPPMCQLVGVVYVTG